jgi:Protein involved in cell division
MSDYFVDGDDILKNKLGIFDSQQFRVAEQDITAKKTACLLDEAPTIFDFEYLRHIHKVLFENIYSFAGQIRTVDIAKPEAKVPFAHAKFIESGSERIFSDLQNKNYLVGIDKQLFVREIANISADLNALHPFREGNGRTIRLFLILLADHAGYLLDYSQVSAKELINADKLAFEGNSGSLYAMYKKITIEIS